MYVHNVKATSCREIRYLRNVNKKKIIKITIKFQILINVILISEKYYDS